MRLQTLKNFRLNDVEKPVRGSRIAELGVSYKGGIGDTRESPGLRIIEELLARGALVSYHDPFVSEVPAFDLTSSDLSEAVNGTDAVVLVTAHPGIEHAAVARAAPLFIDLRGITRGTDAANVSRL